MAYTVLLTINQSLTIHLGNIYIYIYICLWPKQGGDGIYLLPSVDKLTSHAAWNVSLLFFLNKQEYVEGFCNNAMAQADEDHRPDKEMLYEFIAIPMTD